MASEKWTPGQIKYLELNYMNFTNKELAETLGRSKGAVEHKIYKLGLKRILTNKTKENLICSYLKNQREFDGKSSLGEFGGSEYKVCPKCKKILLKTNFYKNKSKKDGCDTYCKECASKYAQEIKAKKRQQEAYNRFKESLKPIEEAKERTAKETYTCKICGKTALGSEFYFNNNTLKRRKECKECTKARNEKNALKRILERGCV